LAKDAMDPFGKMKDLHNSGKFSKAKPNHSTPYQVKKFLLVASLYDYFMLEEDGRLQEPSLKFYQKWDIG
jgi:hypothetical protein